MKTFLRASSVGLLLSAATFLAFVGSLQADNEPPLPTWDLNPIEDPKLAPGRSFSNLLPEGFDQEIPGEFNLSTPGGLKSPPLLLNDSELSPHDLSLFLRGGLLGVPTEVAKSKPTPSLALREAPDMVLESLEGGPRNEYLMDPQALMTEMPTLDLDRLLQFHASEARILLYVLVLDRDQKITATDKLNELVGHLKVDREVCLAVYPLGEPWRTRFLVTQAVNEHSSLNALTEMAEDCIGDALLTNDAEDQLQRFAVRLSTRLFWLEKQLPETVSMTHQGSVLHEVARKPMIETPVQPINEASALPLIGISVLSLLVGGGLVLAWRFWRRSRSLDKQQRVWMLPETEIQPRLGGAFSGGAGAMMQYGSRIQPQGK